MTDLLVPPPSPGASRSPREAPRVIPPSGGMRVPVRLYVGSLTEPTPAAIEALRALASLPFVTEPIVAMPDVETKSGDEAPTGVVLATEDEIVPLAIDGGLNCGVRTIATGIRASEFTPARVDALFTRILGRVPIRPRRDPLFTRDDVLRSLARGARWAAFRLGVDPAEVDAIERQGNLLAGTGIDPEEAAASVPRAAIEMGRRAVGCLGGGHHFLELQEVVRIVDEARADALSLREGDAVFMLHSGSAGVGSLTMSHFSTHGRPPDARSRAKRLLGKVAFHSRRGGFSPASLAAKRRYLFEREFWSVRASSPEGRRLAGAIAAASHFGFVNRMAITQALRTAVDDVFGGGAGPMPLLFDCSHVGIQRESHGGRPLWVHRNGASVALPASRCAGHRVYTTTGQPIAVCGSMGEDSFVCAGSEENRGTFTSANHGAGRVLDTADAIARYSEADVERELAARRVRLFRGGTMNLAEQAPRAFKGTDAVLDAMRRLGVANAIARTRPIAVLKG